MSEKEITVMEEDLEEQFDNWAEAIIAVGSTGTAALIGYINRPHPALLEIITEDYELFIGWDHDPGLRLIKIKMETSYDPWNGDHDAWPEVIDEKEICSGDDLMKLFCQTCGRFNDVRCRTVGCPD